MIFSSLQLNALPFSESKNKNPLSHLDRGCWRKTLLLLLLLPESRLRSSSKIRRTREAALRTFITFCWFMFIFKKYNVFSFLFFISLIVRGGWWRGPTGPCSGSRGRSYALSGTPESSTKTQVGANGGKKKRWRLVSICVAEKYYIIVAKDDITMCSASRCLIWLRVQREKRCYDNK